MEFNSAWGFPAWSITLCGDSLCRVSIHAGKPNVKIFQHRFPWLVDLSVGLLVCWLIIVGWLVFWLVCWLVGRLVTMVSWLFG